MPVKFTPDRPGHYQCRIVLRAPTDIRVFQIEVTVNPDGSDIELEFTTPTHEVVTQTIPVVCVLIFTVHNFLHFYFFVYDFLLKAD